MPPVFLESVCIDEPRSEAPLLQSTSTAVPGVMRAKRMARKKLSGLPNSKEVGMRFIKVATEKGALETYLYEDMERIFSPQLVTAVAAKQENICEHSLLLL